jgi:murein DD-endopeptidase MepM/ murein hydrolase activator NlpD
VVLLSILAAAFGGLALLPARSAPAQVTLLSAPLAPPAATVARPDDTERATIRARPPVRPVVVRKPAVAKKPPAAPRPARASRTRPLTALAGYACPVRGRTSFVDSWGDARPGGRHHQGTDIMAAYGLPVVAVISGVIQTNYSANGGISLYLRGVDGDEYFYAHNSRNVASDGEHVVTGQVIGYVGNTGDARGGPSHVHFELHPGGGRAVDSYFFVRRVCG